MSPDFSKNFATNASLKNVGKKSQGTKQEDIASVPATTKKDIRYFLSVILFALSIIGIGGMFGLNAYLDREIGSIEKNIGTLKEAVKADTIANLTLFDRQSRTLKDLNILRGGYSLLLTEVSKLVVPGVYYTSVSMVLKEGDTYTLIVKGSADSLSFYYQQMQKFLSADGVLNGTVSFDNYSLRRTEGSKEVAVLFTTSFTVPTSDVMELLATKPS